MPFSQIGIFISCDKLALAIDRNRLVGWVLGNLRQVCRHGNRSGVGIVVGTRVWTGVEAGTGVAVGTGVSGATVAAGASVADTMSACCLPQAHNTSMHRVMQSMTVRRFFMNTPLNEFALMNLRKRGNIDRVFVFSQYAVIFF